MKKHCLAIIMLLFLNFMMYGQVEFELKPNQSMSITGKGPGQDAAINPYFGQGYYAWVKNIGKREFSVRIQEAGKIINEIDIEAGELRKIKILSNQELYFDSTSKRKTKATIELKK